MQVAEQDEARAPHRLGGLLWQRNFRLLWTGESISSIGNAMAMVGVPLLAVTVLHASTSRWRLSPRRRTCPGYCPPEMLGRVSASMRFVAFGGIPLGALLAGGLGTALGVRNGLWVILAIYALSGTLLLTGDIRTGRDLPAGAATGMAAGKG